MICRLRGSTQTAEGILQNILTCKKLSFANQEIYLHTCGLTKVILGVRLVKYESTCASSSDRCRAVEAFFGEIQGAFAGPRNSPRSTSSIARLPSAVAMKSTSLCDRPIVTDQGRGYSRTVGMRGRPTLQTQTKITGLWPAHISISGFTTPEEYVGRAPAALQSTRAILAVVGYTGVNFTRPKRGSYQQVNTTRHQHLPN